MHKSDTRQLENECLNGLILASASPRRRELLELINIKPTQVIPANIDEMPLKSETGRQLVQRLAVSKAKTIFKAHQDSYILAADTTVALGRRLLEKPRDENEARAFLEMLSGRRHQVYGGICILAPGGKQSARVCKTTVQFKQLSRKEIDWYIASGEWEGKAGGYGIQGRASAFIKSINGSYSNVVGLSLYDTVNMLSGLGFNMKEEN